MNGLLLINKPIGITSFDCIRRLRRSTGVKKIGHAGTLDPAASGLMILLFGSACKQASQFSKLDKTYVAEITLGATSTTGDREGIITPVIASEARQSQPTEQELRDALAMFVGEITQTPSIYSAIKVAGKEAYKYARKGQQVEIPSRKVTVYSIKLLEYKYPIVRIEAKVSSGTYIRTLAQDIGYKIGTGAYLSALERTSIGSFSLDQVIELDSPESVILNAVKDL
jgi:tRNA pseudouridine55 synthase